jgi:hypothetical protein
LSNTEFKPEPAPTITLQVVNDGKDWRTEAPEYVIDEEKGLVHNIPFKAANAYILKKKASIWQYTTFVNKFIRSLQQVLDNPGSARGMAQPLAEMSSIRTRRVRLEEL